MSKIFHMGKNPLLLLFSSVFFSHTYCATEPQHTDSSLKGFTTELPEGLKSEQKQEIKCLERRNERKQTENKWNIVSRKENNRSGTARDKGKLEMNEY